MSQRSDTRLKIPKVLDKISAMYRIGDIDKDVKDKMSGFAADAIADKNFKKLCRYVEEIRRYYPSRVMDELLEIIIQDQGEN